MSKHYTAVLKIHVTEERSVTTSSSAYGRETKSERSSDEIVSLVVRSEDLPALVAKLAAHVALVEG